MRFNKNSNEYVEDTKIVSPQPKGCLSCSQPIVQMSICPASLPASQDLSILPADLSTWKNYNPTSHSNMLASCRYTINSPTNLLVDYKHVVVLSCLVPGVCIPAQSGPVCNNQGLGGTETLTASWTLCRVYTGASGYNLES